MNSWLNRHKKIEDGGTLKIYKVTFVNKKIVSEINNSLHGFNNRLETVENRICELTDKSSKKIQTKAQKETKQRWNRAPRNTQEM